MKTIESGERPKTSQLVLVSMVAVIGLSILGWPTIENGFSAFRSWMVGRLAEWDTWRPSEKDCILVPERPDPSPLQASQAAASPDRSSERPILRVIHSEVSEREGRGPSLRHARLKGSLASVEPTFPAEMAFESISPDEAAGAASIELRLAVELCRLASGAKADPRIPDASPHPQPGLVASNLVVDIFEENPDGYEPAEEVSASQTSSRPLATTAGPSFEPAEPFEDEDAVVVDWDRWDDGLAMARDFQPVPSVAYWSFEPIVVAEDREQGIAYELNRASDGIGIIPPEARQVRGRKPADSSSDEIRSSAPRPGASPPAHLPSSFEVAHRPASPCPSESTASPGHDELGRAIALTRDAARAWIDVLTGTTSVRMTSR